MEDLPLRISLFAMMLVSLSIHEAAHAWSADRLGDSTARMLGRLTLNPVPHIDPIGTLLLPLLSLATGFPLLGWAKPVPVNLQNLRDPRRDFMLIAAAGPASNILQALVLAGVMRLMFPGGLDESFASLFLVQGIFLNLVLALFNLIPVPPLDGGNVIGGLLPESLARSYDNLVRPFGFLFLYALMLTGVITKIIVPPAIYLLRILVP
ncbi:MAG: site-2 protease family protein [Acidobacteriota bacterium]|nr:site-2 protease family protein [Acidobacteriota bacterium]